MSTQSIRNEQGIALAVAIAALVVIGAMVAGAFFIGLQEQQVGRNTQSLQQALAAAEEGAQLRLANWNPVVSNKIALGDSLAFNGTLSNNAGWYRGYVFRLDSLMFLVRAEGFSPDSQARQHVGMLARLRPIELDVKAGLETQGDVTLSGQAVISGADGNPPGWTNCAATTDTLPGIRTPDPGDISTSGQAKAVGNPGVQNDPTINDSTLTTFGDAVFADLALMATNVFTDNNVQIQPSLSGTACNTSNYMNWGEPLRSGAGYVAACAGYFPVVYSTTSTTVNGVRGQGLLIVNGDVNIQGGFQWKGPVIVKGTLKFGGNGNHIEGGVIAANVIDDNNQFGGNNQLTYSKCAIQTALASGAVAWRLQERSWVNIY